MTNEHLTSNQADHQPVGRRQRDRRLLRGRSRGVPRPLAAQGARLPAADGRPGGHRRRPRRGRAASREGRDPVGVPGRDGEWRPHRPVARDHRRTLRRADRRGHRAEARLAIRPGRLRGHRLGAGRDLQLGPGRSHRAARRRRGAESRGRRFGHVRSRRHGIAASRWPRSRPRSQSQRRPSTKPNAKAAKSCSVRTTSTTKRPSTQRSRS